MGQGERASDLDRRNEGTGLASSCRSRDVCLHHGLQAVFVMLRQHGHELEKPVVVFACRSLMPKPHARMDASHFWLEVR